MLFSVSGGKFHTAVDTSAKPWTPTRAACGRTVTPLNYFESVTDADSYTGGRFEQFFCAQCRAKEVR